MTQQINLFNPIFLKQEKYFSVSTMLQALAIILIGTFAFYAFASYQVSKLREQSTHMAAMLQSEQQKLEQATHQFAPRTKDADIEKKISLNEKRLKSLQEVKAALEGKVIGDTLGYSEYMRAFARQIVQGVWLTGFSIVGSAKEMAITGGTMQPGLLPQYIQRLRNEKVMAGHAFGILEMTQPEVEPKEKEQASSVENEKVVQRPEPAPYIKFRLQSTGLERASLSGAEGGQK